MHAAKRVREKCVPARRGAARTRFGIERRQAYIFLVILKYERRRRRRQDSDHYSLSLATRETADYVSAVETRQYQHNASVGSERDAAVGSEI